MSCQPKSKADCESVRLAEQVMQVFDDTVPWRLSPLLGDQLCTTFRKAKFQWEDLDGDQQSEGGQQGRKEHGKQTRQESNPDDGGSGHNPSDEPKTRPSTPVRYTRGHKLFRTSSYSYIDWSDSRNNIPDVPEELPYSAVPSLNDDAGDDLDEKSSEDDSDSDSETVVDERQSRMCLTPVPTTPKNRCVDLPETDDGVDDKEHSRSDVNYVRTIDEVIKFEKGGKEARKRPRQWRRSRRFFVINNVSGEGEGDGGIDDLTDKFGEFGFGFSKSKNGGFFA
ncbi:hypothetical protein L218DRAFT_987107 [Marasmius fiardii PR-910]|nr:hypothetical protein L218DRAFT_987107 [Marasmius fiardii PR-910]